MAWTHISLDFVEGLPRSEGKDVILVVVDRFTKYAHFIPLSHPYTMKQVADLFQENIARLHGQPSVIVSDRDRVFTSGLWQNLFKAMGVKLHLSSAYHPQTDGQTERVNQCLE
jgi:transposase InsO family protein